MDVETIVLLSVFGGLLILNLISLLLVYVTPYGKEFIANLKKNESKAYFIFWNIWMVFTGVTFWIAAGVGEIIKWARSLQAKKSE